MPRKPTTIPSKSLRAFLDASKRESRLVAPLERHLLQRPFDKRRMDVLHPSDIIKPEFCALAAFHALSGNYVETREKPGLRLQSIFDEGHSIHAKWQAWVADMGNLYGYWKCDACGYRSSRMTDQPVCAAGHDRGFTYAEVPLESPLHCIYGHSDGWVVGLGNDFLIEIKSIGIGTIRKENPSLLNKRDGEEGEEALDAAWRKIRQPFRSHLLQGQVYLHLAHLMAEQGKLDRPAPEEIVFIYELKSNQDYKEFSVMYDASYVESFFDTALDIVFAVDKKLPPACSVDPVKGCERCLPYRGEK